jgi:SAM-dependent methyltransferase
MDEQLSMMRRNEWLAGPLGTRVQALERKLLGEVLAQVFGWQLLQIGQWGGLDALLNLGRTQRCGVIDEVLPRLPERVLGIRSRLDSLAVASDSVDAVLLPHTLECVANPHELLREVERILLGDGQLIVMGFRPSSLWGLRNLLVRDGFPPHTEHFIAEYRLRDWLKLLGFEVIEARRYLFTWPWGSASPPGQRLLEHAGAKLWPLVAGGYLLQARKRVYALTPIRPRWRMRSQVVGGLIEPTTRVAKRVPGSKGS